MHAAQVIASGLYGKTATLRVKQSAMEFAVWVFKHATDAQLKPMAPIVFKGLLHMLTTLEISEQSQVMMLRGFLYQAVGQLAVVRSRGCCMLAGSSIEKPASLLGLPCIWFET